jgi:hypothetical protein
MNLLGSPSTCWASQPCWAKPLLGNAPMKYSLRSLMIVMLLAGPCSLIARESWQAWRRTQRPTCQPSLKQLKIAIHSYFASHPQGP